MAVGGGQSRESVAVCGERLFRKILDAECLWGDRSQVREGDSRSKARPQ